MNRETLYKRYKITGRVQGVFFRATTKDHADALGINGWVRNCPDGSVEVFAEGTQQQLNRFEAWLHRGPPAARVEAVREQQASPERNIAFTVQK